MHAGFRHLGTHGDEIEYISEFLVVCPRRGHDSVLVAPENGRMRTTPVYSELKRDLEHNPVDFLVLDHIGHVFAGNNDDRVHVTQFINAMVALQPLKEYALILLGHPSRGDDSTYGGSIAWDFGVRQRWYMGGSPPGSKIEPQDGTTYLTLEKANDRPKREPIRLQYRDGVFVPDAVVTNSSGVIVTRAEQALQFVASCICDFLQEGIRVTSSAQSPDFLPKVLAHRGSLGKFREDELANALAELKAGGKLIEQEYGKTDQRKTKYTLAVKP
jgi:RecA-family ATPase